MIQTSPAWQVYQAELFVQAMKKLELTPESVAERCTVPARSIRDWIAKEAELSIPEMQDIWRVLRAAAGGKTGVSDGRGTDL